MSEAKTAGQQMQKASSHSLNRASVQSQRRRFGRLKPYDRERSSNSKLPTRQPFSVPEKESSHNQQDSVASPGKQVSKSAKLQDISLSKYRLMVNQFQAGQLRHISQLGSY